MQSFLMGVLALATSLQAYNEPKPSTSRERYEALLKQYDASPGVYANDQQKARTAAEPFLELARDRPDDAVAVEALGWVATHCLFQPQAREAMGLMTKDQIKSERMGHIIQTIDKYYGDPFQPMEELFRKAMEESPHREVRGWACLALARYLTSEKEKAERDFHQHSLFLKGENVPFAPEPKFSQVDLKRLTEESAAHLDRVIKSYGDIRVGDNTLGAVAESELFEIRNISVGKMAPEIEGRDIDGRQFRLSDYRGKVIILSFSGNWCGPCRGMYPQERELVERLKDKPFVLLSVNTDKTEDTLKKSIETKEITWRCWRDGGIDGPITTKWNIEEFPTIYIIDSKFVVRFKNPQGKALDRAADSLLKELEAAAKS